VKTVKVHHADRVCDVDEALARAVAAREARYDTIHQALDEIDKITVAIDGLLDQRNRTGA
jgi:hypothetical protein